MTTILDLARDEIAVLERRLATLRTIEAAALELDNTAPVEPPPVDVPAAPYKVPEQLVEPPPADEPAPAAPAAPPAKPQAPRPTRTTVRDIDSKILGALLKTNRRMSAQQIAESTGIEKETLRKPLQRLVAAGQVLAEGATKSRVYRAGGPPEPSERRIAHTNGVKKAATSETNGVMRVKVLDLIRRDPGCLDENRIAAGLLADREDVAVACGKLLEDDKVILNPDGTYTATRPRAGVRT